MQQHRTSITTRRSRFIWLIALTVAGGAFLAQTASATPSGATVDDFVLLAENSITVGPNTIISSGDIGVRTDSGSSPEIRFNSGAQLTDPAATVFGDFVKLDSGSTVTNVHYNNLLAGPGAVTGTSTTPLDLPVVPALPTAPPANPGTTDIAVPAAGSQTIAPGAYNELTSGSGATITLSGGEYHFTSWDLGPSTTVIIDAAVDIRIADHLFTDNSFKLEPAAASGLAASDIQIAVLGTNLPGPQPGVAKLKGDITAHVLAPNGRLALTTGTATGQYIAQTITTQGGTIVHDIGSTASWEPTTLSASLAPGQSLALSTTLVLASDLAVPGISVSGSAAPLVIVEPPDPATTIPAGTTLEIPITVNAPVSTAIGTYTATFSVTDNGIAQPDALSLTVIVNPLAEAFVGLPLPSLERVMPSDVGPNYVSEEIVVRIDESAPDPEASVSALAAGVGGVVVGGVPELRSYQIQLLAPLSITALRSTVDTLETDSDVEFATVNYLLEPHALPNDPEWDSWDEASPAENNWYLEYIQAPTGWDTATGSSDVTVAILDADIDAEHEDLAPNVTIESGFRIPSPILAGHGTRTAGLACAAGNNNVGISGIAWSCGLQLYHISSIEMPSEPPPYITQFENHFLH